MAGRRRGRPCPARVSVSSLGLLPLTLRWPLEAVTNRWEAVVGCGLLPSDVCVQGEKSLCVIASISAINFLF